MENLLHTLSFDGFDTAILTRSHKGILSHTDTALQKLLDFALEEVLPEEEVRGVRFTSPAPVKQAVVVPLPEFPSYSDVEKLFAKAAAQAVTLGSKRALLVLDDSLSPALAGKAYETVLLASYSFDRYRVSPKAAPSYALYSPLSAQEEAKEGELLARVTNQARDLVNEPSNVLTPRALAKAAMEAALLYGLTCRVLEPAEIEKLGMGAFLAVGKGGANPPELITLRYTGDEKSEEVLGLIGKGITYDSGGYCLKNADGMSSMKCDMGGAAAVIGAICAVAQQKLKINAVAVIAACENMISGGAYRPGDIVRTMAGKTVEVLNTDAEGRLTLADAITYAIEREKVTKVVDIATLTGAAVVALGENITAVLASDNELYAALEGASIRSCEKVWRLPCDEDLGSLLKSHIADLKNVAGREAGTIVAGMFLKTFTQGLPWLHLDIAGPAYIKKDTPLCPTGGTGSGVRMLYHLAKSLVE